MYMYFEEEVEKKAVQKNPGVFALYAVIGGKMK